MKFISRKNLLLSLFVIINLICAFFLNYVGKHTLQTITIGSFEISSISVKGIFSAIQSLTCFMMVFINYRKGFVIALFASTNGEKNQALKLKKYDCPFAISVSPELFHIATKQKITL